MILADLQPAAVTSLRAVALYTAVASGALLTLVWRSEIGIYLLAVLLPLQTTRYHLHALPFGANMVDIVILCVLLGSLIRSNGRLAYRSATGAFLLFMAIFYLASLWRGAFYLGTGMPVWISDPRLVDYKNFIVMPLLAFAAVRTIRTRRQIMVLLLLCGITALAVDYSYLKSSLGRDFAHYAEETRDAGPLGYAGENGLASYLVEATALVLPMLAVRKQPWLRLFALAVASANIVCILFSYSREAYLALAAILCFFAVVKVRWLFIPILLLVVSWQTVLPVAVQERIAMTYTHPDDGMEATLDASAEERMMLWTDAMSLFRQNPVVGTGFLTYAELSRIGSYKDTHNFYLKMLVETGLVGLALFGIQLLLFFIEGLRLFARSPDSFLALLGLGYAGLILAAATVNLFGDRWMFIQVDSNLWIFLGCILSGLSLATISNPQPEYSRARRSRADYWITNHPRPAYEKTAS